MFLDIGFADQIVAIRKLPSNKTRDIVRLKYKGMSRKNPLELIARSDRARMYS